MLFFAFVAAATLIFIGLLLLRHRYRRWRVAQRHDWNCDLECGGTGYALPVLRAQDSPHKQSGVHDALRRRGSPRQLQHHSLASSGSDSRLPVLLRHAPSATSIVVESDFAMHEVCIGPRIGGGAFGTVYLGKYRGTEVAVKLVNASSCGDSFAREASTLSKLRHPNIILYMGSCLDPRASQWAIVTEFVRRGSLWDVLREDALSPWGQQQHALVALGIAKGLAFLHAHSPPILHRDIKSANVLCDDYLRVKLCDVGLAKRQDAMLTVGCGTPQWCAPECLAGLPYGTPADVYSFGIVLAEILTRQCPYADQPHLTHTGVALAIAVVQTGLRPHLGHHRHTQLAQLAKACWAHDPDARLTIDLALPMLEHLVRAAPEM